MVVYKHLERHTAWALTLSRRAHLQGWSQTSPSSSSKVQETSPCVKLLRKIPRVSTVQKDLQFINTFWVNRINVDVYNSYE